MSGNSPRETKGFPDFAIPVNALGPASPLAVLLRVPIDYVLEMYDDTGKFVTCITLPNTPEDFECTRPLAASIRHTLGNLPIRQIVESKHRGLILKGRSGIQPRQGYTRKGDLKFQDGRDILLEFDGFLQDYTKLQETYQGGLFSTNKKEQPTLVFRAFNEKINLLVEPDFWSWRRSADTSRLSYEWTLNLTAYGYSNKKGIPQNVFSPLDDYAQSVGDAINLAATGLAGLSNATDNLRNDVKALISPTLNSLRNTGLAAQGLAGAANRLALFPKETLASFVTATATFVDAVDRFREVANPFDGDTYRTEIETLRALFGEKANECLRVSNQALFVAGGGPSDVSSAQSELRASDVPTTTTSSVSVQERKLLSVYITKTGDTLIKIAARVLGDADRWTEIASANNFTDSNTFETGTLAPGTRLLVPTAGIREEQAVIGATSTYELLGKDLAIDLASGDLVLHAGDIALRSSTQNLEQALAIRLLTPQRTLPLFPEYGLPIVPGIGMTSRVAAYAGLHCKEQVLRDSRISEVREIKVHDEGDGIAVSMRIVPVGGGNMDFIAPLSVEA